MISEEKLLENTELPGNGDESVCRDDDDCPGKLDDWENCRLPWE